MIVIAALDQLVDELVGRLGYGPAEVASYIYGFGACGIAVSGVTVDEAVAELREVYRVTAESAEPQEN